MDIAAPNQHPATSDDELAKVLAGIGADESPSHTAQAGNGSNAEAAGLQFEETPGPMPAGATNANSSPVPPAPTEPVAPEAPAAPTPPLTPNAMPPMDGGPSLPSIPGLPNGLDQLKKTALEELRPLVGKLNLPPEDKFDTLLLIIRSTDDQSLLEPAHEAAKQIPDENKRAQALLDVIKEIDYFAAGGQPPQAPVL